MDDLWQQFHRLPKAIRDAVARPEALAAVDSLEQRYPSLDLASFIMRAVVKEFPMTELENRLQEEFHLAEADAAIVSSELTATVFSGINDYLGLVKPAPKGPLVTSVPPTPPPSPANLPVASLPPKPQVSQTEVTAPITPPVSSVGPARPPVPVPSTTPIMSVPLISPAGPGPASPIGPVAPTQAYSDEDAAEIAQQARKLQDMSEPVAMSLDDIATAIINQHHLAFHDELLAKRAVAILKARLKDIRDKDETLMMLVRGPKVGGLGLDQDLAKNVVNSLEEKAGAVKARGMVRAPDPIMPPPPPAIPPLGAKKPEPKPPLFRDAASAAAARPMMPPPPAPPAPQSAPVKPAPMIKRPADIPMPPSMNPSTPPATPKPTPMMTRPRTIERPAIADITRPTKMLGPAEEMRTMTLTEFRRLGQGAGESTKRLLEKFNELQRESFTIWSDALQGWRQSEVYQLYLAMGRQSMEQAMGITEVIKQRSAANQLYLSEHEFTALADLNRQLQR